jgi:hypothetical protein
VSIAESEIDEMLLREFANASRLNRRADVERLSRRAVDKVLAEFKLLGFTGFQVSTDADGNMHIEGTPLRSVPMVRP